MIDSCLKLHGRLCPPEMLAFHATLEKFFHKNFAEEVQRLPVDPTPEPRAMDAVPTSTRPPPSAAMPSPNYNTMYVPIFVFLRDGADYSPGEPNLSMWVPSMSV